MSFASNFARHAALVLALALAACGGDPKEEPPPEPPVREKETLPEPGPLLAGVATVKLPVPLGIGTMGYGAIGEAPSVTPFADTFPGTIRQHAALTVKAVALSRGPGHEVILVRSDTVGVFQQLREAVLDQLRERLGRDLSHALVLAGNHTHSGPGRVLMTDGALRLLGDTFFPEFYDRMVSAFADVVEAAIADQAPAEIGIGIASSSDAHNDRRCENDPLDQLQEDPSMPLFVVRREGVVDAVVMSYAYHGTVLGMGDLTLSGDMGAVVEQKVEERFDHPVTVLFFNSWGGDMSPGSAQFDDEEPSAHQPFGFDRMESLGRIVADAALPVIESVSFSSEVPVRARTFRARLDREVLGYARGEFNYAHGAVFCGFGLDGVCSHVSPRTGLDRICVKISENERLPKQTLFTAGEIGGLAFITAPGEWSTNLAHGVVAAIRARTGGDVMFIGYANDYTGYSLNEADWWQGGYEASGALWGPKQGDYLAARAIEIFETYQDLYLTPSFEEPEPVPPFDGYAYAPYVPETAVSPGTIAADVPSTVARDELVRFTVQGADPWLGTPVAVLEREVEGEFEAVRRPNGVAVDSDGYDMWVELEVDPPYTEPAPEDRTFRWTFAMPAVRRVPSTIPPLDGAHRFRVTVPTVEGPLVVHSSSFAIE